MPSIGPIELLIILFLCVFSIAVLALIVWGVIQFTKKQSPNQQAPASAPMKKCPYCAEQILEEAIVCRYCGRDLK